MADATINNVGKTAVLPLLAKIGATTTPIPSTDNINVIMTPGPGNSGQFVVGPVTSGPDAGTQAIFFTPQPGFSGDVTFVATDTTNGFQLLSYVVHVNQVGSLIVDTANAVLPLS